MTETMQDFIQAILRSGLLTQKQIDLALEILPAAVRDTPEALSSFLVQTEKLTPFQAQKLSSGRTQGLVIGPYQIQAPIGKGGMGCVYLALDTRTQIPVALKILIPSKAKASEHYITRFQREKELSQRVCHPHLAITFDAGTQGNLHFIAMEFIPGQTLFRLVTKEGPLAVPRAARIFAEVADGLAHAHQQGLIHRDLKPSNIMVTPNGHAKVLDLGLAFIEGERVENVEVQGGKGYLVGSVDYMAPEQTFDSSRVDPRSDVYALGCCLYFALTGKAPFAGLTHKEKIQAQRATMPEPIDKRNSTVPSRFASIVQRYLAKDPQQRPASASDVAKELRSWSDSKLGEAPVETQGDAAFFQAVHQAATGPATFEMVSEDELLFAIDEPAATEPSRVEFVPVKPSFLKTYGLHLVVGLGALVLLTCMCAGVVGLLLQLVRTD